jgi:hypothetical protein
MTTVTLGGREYDIIALSPNKADIWREKVRLTLANFTGITEDEKNTESEKPDVTKAASKMFDDIFNMACKAPEIIRDLLFEYSPAVAADKARLMDESNDEELVEGFVVCARKAFPFGKLLSLARSGFATT